MASDDRLRVSVEDTYLTAIGMAAYAFSILEWTAIWCGERIERNFIDQKGELVAGRIADALIKCIGTLDDPELRAQCEQPAGEFKRLVGVRNAIFHAKPATTADGAQRLMRHGRPWEPQDINAASDDFAACSMVLNGLLHGPLKALRDADDQPA